jgi:hypothetical protein
MFPSLHGLPPHEPKPMPGTVAPLPSTGVVMSPKPEPKTTTRTPDMTQPLDALGMCAIIENRSSEPQTFTVHGQAVTLEGGEQRTIPVRPPEPPEKEP